MKYYTPQQLHEEADKFLSQLPRTTSRFMAQVAINGFIKSLEQQEYMTVAEKPVQLNVDKQCTNCKYFEFDLHEDVCATCAPTSVPTNIKLNWVHA